MRVAADEVETLLAEVRERVSPDKALVWWLDPDTQPSDLHERLLALGLREPRDRGATLHALACLRSRAETAETTSRRPVLTTST